jgi:acetyltransferase-like isoleucine patch superfamily enzyme
MLKRLALIFDRVMGKRFALRRLHKQVDIDQTTRLEPKFGIDFRVAPEERVYVRIGKHAMLNTNIIFESRAGMVEIGDRTIGEATIICREKITIGSDVVMAWGIVIYDHNSNSLDWRRRAKVARHFYDTYGKPGCYEGMDWTDVKSAPVVIEDKVWIGFDAVILKGVRIGEGAVIGARSVVTHDVEPYTVVAGNPAVVVRRLEKI